MTKLGDELHDLLETSPVPLAGRRAISDGDGRTDLVRPHRLAVDDDVVHLLQEAYPLVDDPAARAAIVAAFAGRTRPSPRSRGGGRLAIALLALGAVPIPIAVARRRGRAKHLAS